MICTTECSKWFFIVNDIDSDILFLVNKTSAAIYDRSSENDMVENDEECTVE